MSSHARSFVFSKCTRPSVGISITSGNYLTKYQSQLYAESTKATYKTHLDNYLRFCLYMGYTPVPVQHDHLLQYAAFSARCLKDASKRSYLNIIGIPHKQFGLLNPLLDKWPLKSLKTLLTGINRQKARKTPFPSLLLCSYSSMIGLIWKVASRSLSICRVRSLS